MRYIFFCIYNSQYLDGKNKVNKTPWIDALGMMMGGSFFCISILVEIYYFYILNQNVPLASGLNFITVCFGLFGIHYFLFIKDKKYEDIYEQYKSSNKNNRKNNVSVSLLYIFLPAAISVLIALKWHKII